MQYVQRLIEVHKLISKKYRIRYFFMTDLQKYRFRCKLMGEIPEI